MIMNIKPKSADDAELDAKVIRWRERKQTHVEACKEYLVRGVLNNTPEQHHEDLFDAMLEIAIDTKLKALGDEIATDIINLVIKRRIKTRGTLN